MGSNTARLRSGAVSAVLDLDPPRPDERRENIRVLIADAHTMFREGLRALLESAPGFVVVGEACAGTDVLRLARERRPDLILLDMEMPRLDGMEVLRALADSELDVKTLVLTAAINQADTLLALQMGVRGVVLKSDTGRVLFESLRRVMAGEYWLGRDGMAGLIEAVRMTAQPPVSPGTRFGVTPREAEVIAAVVAGSSNQKIAERYGISEQTVKHHITNIFDKLGVYSRLELALFAVNHNLAGKGV